MWYHTCIYIKCTSILHVYVSKFGKNKCGLLTKHVYDVFKDNVHVYVYVVSYIHKCSTSILLYISAKKCGLLTKHVYDAFFACNFKSSMSFTNPVLHTMKLLSTELT